jgi:hypothetical protein
MPSSGVYGNSYSLLIYIKFGDLGTPVYSVSLPMQRLPRMPGEQREAHIGRTLGSVAPSMLLCSLSEAICFFLGEQGLSFSTRDGIC